MNPSQMDVFLQQFGPAKFQNIVAQPQDTTITYKLYGGRIELMYDDTAEAYFVRGKDDTVYKQVNRVTHITGTLHKEALLPWGIKVAAEEIIAQIEKRTFVDEQGNRMIKSFSFDDFVNLVGDAKKEHRRISDTACDIGHIAHGWLEDLQKLVIKDRISIREAWESGKQELPVIRPNLDGLDERRQSLTLQVAQFNTEATQNCVREAVSWMLAHNYRPLKVENKVYSIIHNVAGTFDAIALVDSCQDPNCCGVLRATGTRELKVFKDLKVLVDWKSSKDMYDEHRFQTATYWEFWLEEHGERLGGRFVVKMPKTVGDSFEGHFLPNEDQAKDFKAFVGLLYPFERIAEISALEAAEKAIYRAQKKQQADERKAAEEAAKQAARELREADRAAKKLIEEEAARFKKEEKCSWADRYKGKTQPKCNENKGCTACNTKYAEAHNLKYDPVEHLFYGEEKPVATE